MNKKKIYIRVIRGKNSTIVFPVLSEETVKQFNFFLDAHEDPVCPRIIKKETQYKIARDVCGFVRLFRQTPELIEFVAKIRHLLHDNSARITGRFAICNFLKRLQSLDDFFDFHEERELPIRDQRSDLLLVLRSDVKMVIRFLQKRAQ